MQFSPYRVLFLAANPSSTSRLRLDREIREVDESLRRSQYRDQFRLFQQQAVRMVDLRRALLDVKPHILHFSGHGVGKEGLLLDDDQSGHVMVDSSVLANLVKLSPHIKCVVLNACYSYLQAMAIAQHIPYAIGMERAIGDEAAIQFSQAFYDAIFAGEAIAKAYQFGIANGKGQPVIYDARTITLASEPETHPPLPTIPVLIVGKVADPDQGQFPLNASGAADLGAIQFGPVGQQAAGQGILQIQAQSLTGCVINNIVQVVSNPPGEAMAQAKTVGVKVQPRPLPVQLPPKAFPQLVGRQAEIETAISTLPYRQPVEFYGQPGIGKTVLLRHLAHHPAIAPTFSGGLIYHRIRQYQSASDILQVLFNTFYETETPYKPTNAEIRQFLQNRDVLTLLDGSELSRDQVDALIVELPDFTFLFTSNEQQLWGEGRSIKLDGLTATSAVALVSRDVGRTLTATERQAVAQLCTTLQGHPLRLLQAAALAREEKKELGAIALQFQSAPGEATQCKQLVASLQKPQLLILSLLAALGGKAIAAEMIAAITQLPDVITNLEVLVRRYLVVVEADASGEERYRLSKNFLAFLSGVAGLAAWKLAVVDYFTRWVGRQPDLALLTDNAEVLHQTMQWAIEAEQWPQVIHLGKSLESTFAVNGQWDAWKHVLEALLQAAQMTGDPVVEAYALHQLGSRALGLNELTEAQDCLERALEIRTVLGDRAGIEATQQNLDFLRPLIFNSPSNPPDSPDLPEPLVSAPSVLPVHHPGWWPWIAAGVGIIGTVATGIVLSQTTIELPLPTEVQLVSFELTPDTVQGTETVEGQVELSAPATESVTIELSSTNADVVPVEPIITLDAGESQETFILTAGTVSEETSVQITAVYGDRRLLQTLTIRPDKQPSIELKALNLEPLEVPGGTPARATVELMQPAPTNLELTLRSSNPQVAEVPEVITITAGETVSGWFDITTKAVNEPARVTLRATYRDRSTENYLAVVPQASPQPAPVRLREVVIEPNPIEGGTAATGTVFLEDDAPEDITVQLQSENTGIEVLVDDQTTIPASRRSTTFQVRTRQVDMDTPVNIIASYGNQRVQTNLMLRSREALQQACVDEQDPVSVAQLSNYLTISLPESANEGDTVNGTIRLTDCIPPSGGLTIALSSSDDNLVQQLTPNITFYPAPSDATFFRDPSEEFFSFSILDDLANYPNGGTVKIYLVFQGQELQSRSLNINPPCCDPITNQSSN